MPPAAPAAIDATDTTLTQTRERGQPPPPLTCVAVVFYHSRDEEATARHQVGLLLHAVTSISAFLDFGCAPFWNMPRACEHNSLSLVRHLTKHESVDMNVHYRAYLFKRGLVHAVQNDNMEVVQWLCDEYCPTSYVWKGVEEAAASGRTTILECLTRRYGLVQSPSMLMDLAARNGHLETVQWIHSNLSNDEDYWPDTMMPAAIKKGDFAAVKWLHEHYPHKAQQNCLLEAIRSGNVEVAEFLFCHDYKLGCPGRKNIAAVGGNLEMVKRVYSHSMAFEPNSAVNLAAFNGHFEVVK